METSQLLFWIYLFTAWLIYLFFQAIFINGVKLSASGSTIILPDGSTKDSEMILFPMAKYLLQKKQIPIYYKGHQLELLLREFKTMNALKGLIHNGNKILFTETTPLAAFRQVINHLEKEHGIVININHGETSMNIYKNFDEYKFPAWIRKPIIECVICMSSFYGLFIFLLPVAVLSKNWIVVPAYIINTVALSCVNKIVFKLT